MKIKKTRFITPGIIIIMLFSPLVHGEEKKDPFSFINLTHDLEYSYSILDWQDHVTGISKIILEGGNEVIGDSGLMVSGAFWGNYLHEESNTVNKFPILSRFPSERNNGTDQADRWLISNAAVALTFKPEDWITGFVQYEFTEVEFPGQEDWQARKYMVILGNLDKSPLYGYFGRNTVDFGLMNGYNPFTHTVNNHSFRIDSDDPVIAAGYASDNLHIVGTLIPGGRHLRVADSDDPDGWNNGAVNLTYTFGGQEDSEWQFRVGGGYLHSTIYNNDTPHHPGPTHEISKQASPDLTRNAAYDVFAEALYGPFRLGVEYTTTAKGWPATGVRVESTNIQAAYEFDLFNNPSRFSIVRGINEQGPSGTEYEDLTQLVVGLETQLTDNFSLSAEWVRNDGFVPLINIRTVSDADVSTDAILIGAKIQF